MFALLNSMAVTFQRRNDKNPNKLHYKLHYQEKNLDKFGWFKDDPTFDDLQMEIAAYRREIDEEMGLG